MNPKTESPNAKSPALFPTSVFRLNSLLYLLFAVGIFYGCRKVDDIDDKQTAPSVSTLTLNIQHKVDSLPFLPDTLMYQNAAGNQYRVTRLEYFISRVVLTSPEGDITVDSIYYVNAKTGVGNQIVLRDIPRRHYSGMKFYIGLDSVHNISNSLPPTVENQAMAWPDPMGGGYHFMKMEGHFTDSAALPGFAIHLGRNPNLTEVVITRLIHAEEANETLSLIMNLNEWFTNPYVYNLKTDGSYTMNNMAAMQKISTNGRDVFRLEGGS